MDRQGADKTCERPGDPGMASRLAGSFIAHIEDFESEPDEARGGIFGIEFEHCYAGRRLFCEIGLARVDQSVEVIARQVMAAYSGGERLDDLVLAQRQAAIDRIDRLAPPL